MAPRSQQRRRRRHPEATQTPQQPESTPDPNAQPDYDTDGDGLIEINNLEQMDATRYDPDEDGVRWTLKTWTATAMMISSSTLPPPVATPPLSHHRRRSCLRRWRVHRLRVVPPPGFRRSGQLRLRTGQHRLDTGRRMDAHPAMPGLCQRLHEKGHPDLRRAIPAYMQNGTGTWTTWIWTLTLPRESTTSGTSGPAASTRH